MKCPNCGSNNTRVLDSRERSQGVFVYRQRECCECGTRWRTHEVYAEKKEKPKVENETVSKDMTVTDAIGYFERQIDMFQPATKPYKAFTLAITALRDQEYTEWLEKVFEEYEPVTTFCDELLGGTDWCEENCVFESPEAKCFRHAFYMRKNNETEV